MKKRLPPIGFWSYARLDDDRSDNKRVTRLHDRIESELQLSYGRDQVSIFQDTSGIAHGVEWEKETIERIHQSTFLIPIITPNFIQSEWCIREVREFLAREEELSRLHPGLRRPSRIFPIYYRPIRDRDAHDPELLAILNRLERCDLDDVRDLGFANARFKRKLRQLVEDIRDLLFLEVESDEGTAAEAGRAAERPGSRRREAESSEAEDAERRAAAETEARKRQADEEAERERAEALAAEAARLEAEEAERERVEALAAEAARLEAEEAERERAEALAAEAARLEAEEAERERAVALAAEAARLETEEAERKGAEALAAKTARMEAERLEQEQREREAREAEEAEKQRLRDEAERVEAERRRAAEAAERADRRRAFLGSIAPGELAITVTLLAMTALVVLTVVAIVGSRPESSSPQAVEEAILDLQAASNEAAAVAGNDLAAESAALPLDLSWLYRERGWGVETCAVPFLISETSAGFSIAYGGHSDPRTIDRQRSTNDSVVTDQETFVRDGEEIRVMENNILSYILVKCP